MSVYAIATSGLIAQGKAASAYAQNVVSQSAPVANYIPVDPVSISQDGGGVLSALRREDGASLEDQLVGLQATKINYAANAKVIGVQRDMDQELLNIFA